MSIWTWVALGPYVRAEFRVWRGSAIGAARTRLAVRPVRPMPDRAPPGRQSITHTLEWRGLRSHLLSTDDSHELLDGVSEDRLDDWSAHGRQAAVDPEV